MLTRFLLLAAAVAAFLLTGRPGAGEAAECYGYTGPDGLVTPALAVLHTLVFDFLNHRTGRLDPSYAAIARKAGVPLRAVSDALRKLRELGLLHRIRRCVEDWQDGQFRLRQETNAYMLLPESYWRGWRPSAEPPAPAQGTWGDPEL